MTSTPVAVFEIKNYMVIFRQLEKRDFGGVEAQIRGLVRCSGEDHRLDVYFLMPDSAVPAPQINIAEKQGSIFLSTVEMQAFIDVLRNEKPIYGHLRGDRPEWTSITTTDEPVGAGDEDY